MICKNCGNEIRDDAKFCPHCGAVSGEAVVAKTAGPEIPAGGGRKKGLLIGGAVAAVAVIALLTAVVSGMFASPKGQAEKALAKSVAAYAAAGEKIGVPDLYELTDRRSVSQNFELELGSINSAVTGYDLSALQGLGLRMNTGLDGDARRMSFELGAFWGEEDILSLRMLADDDEVYVVSPQFTGGTAYGVNTETLGEDLTAMGVEDAGSVSFNLFDLMDLAVPAGQYKEIRQQVQKANKALWEAAEVEKTGSRILSVNGAESKTTAYRIVFPQAALEDYVDAMAELMNSVNYFQLYEELLRGMGMPQEELDSFMDELEELDVYGELADGLKELIGEVGDLELEVDLSGGCVAAVFYQGELYGSQLELSLYLGGGEAYVDDLCLEIGLDGQVVTLDSTGDHSARGGAFTDVTEIRGSFPTIISDLRYDLGSHHLEWELELENAGGLDMAGQLVMGKNSIDLNLEDISLQVMGLEVCSLGLDYYMGPCEGVDVTTTSSRMLTEMDETELTGLAEELQASAMTWMEEIQALILQRLPQEVLWALMFG